LRAETVFNIFSRMNMSDKTRLHDLRLKLGLGIALPWHEREELQELQAKERAVLQEALEHADSEFAAIVAT
jgi:hypothetical protein